MTTAVCYTPGHAAESFGPDVYFRSSVRHALNQLLWKQVEESLGIAHMSRVTLDDLLLRTFMKFA